jgi:Ring finger domain
MGNSASSPRPDFLQRQPRRFRQLRSDRGEGDRALEDENTDRPLGVPRAQRSRSLERSRRQSRSEINIYGTFRRQISSQSITVQRETGETIGTDAIVYEQEERPLVNMEDLGMRDAPITHVAAAPLARRPSTMSRLGSRMLPSAVARSLLNSGEETAAEGEAHRMGLSGRRWNEEEFQRLADGNRPRRTINTIFRTSRTTTTSNSRRHTIRGPFTTPYARGQPLGDEPEEESPSLFLPSSDISAAAAPSEPASRRGRRSRVRNSLSFPLHSLFSHSSESSTHQVAPRTPPRRPSRVAFADDSDHLLPPLSTMDHRLDLDDSPHELDAVEPEARNVLSNSRLSQNGMRRLPHALRSRSTRLIRRGEHPPLSQVLQLAAASIAAQLSGHPSPLASGIRSMGNDVLDGPIQNFVRTLQEAADAQAGENMIPSGSADGSLPPVNFLRVFQFPNTEPAPSTASSSGPTAAADHPPGENLDDPATGTNNERTVTLVLVGVRSMPSNGEGSGEESALGPSLDALLSMPFFPTTNVLRSGASGALLRRSEARSRLSSRRNSMTNFSSFPAQYDSQRHHRPRNTVSRSPTESTLPTSQPSSMPTVLSESPPGPNPPPSTPADARSGTATPNRRPSSASAIHSPNLPHLDEHPSIMSDNNSSDASLNTARQRRRSDSEFARRPELSSGATRRNGVVEPDNAPQTGGRSWLIYVVGTNVSPDHPAFTMPSLFTDSPSYEDMQLLSTLLGPVKPPVATQDDVVSAGGVYNLVQGPESLVGQSVVGEGEPSIAILAGDRCLICLCDYEAKEEVRRLGKCQHMYHRECIDEVRRF